MNFRFKRPVYFGDTVTCNFIITDIDDQGRSSARVEYRNQDDILVLEAFLKGIIPGAKEKNVMEVMVAEGDPTNGIC